MQTKTLGNIIMGCFICTFLLIFLAGIAAAKTPALTVGLLILAFFSNASAYLFVAFRSFILDDN